MEELLKKIEELEANNARQRTSLEKYFPSNVVERILSDEPTDSLRGEHLEATILFFDLRASTKIAESLEPIVFSEFLSELFTDIMDLIYGNGGSVNKLIGDGIMATFGCPFSLGDDAFRCAKSALDIKEYLHTFNDVRPDYLKDPVSAGIGIATGKVFAGYVGSVRRMEYTVLGDAVNLSSRLESLTKEYSGSILMDRNTLEKIASKTLFSTVGSIDIRGKNEPVDIFTLNGLTC
jgi:adenylate cyclase